MQYDIRYYILYNVYKLRFKFFVQIDVYVYNDGYEISAVQHIAS